MTKSRNNVIILQAIKNYTILKWGLGRSPKRGEGGSPTFSPGTDAGRVCTRALHDAKPTKHTQPFTGERGLWFRQGCRDRTPKGFMQGRIQVVEQSRCRTHRQQTTTIAETQSPQSVLIGIENLLYFYKNRLFLQAECNYLPFIEAKNTVFLKTTLFITLTHQ